MQWVYRICGPASVLAALVGMASVTHLLAGNRLTAGAYLSGLAGGLVLALLGLKSQLRWGRYCAIATLLLLGVFVLSGILLPPIAF